MKNDNLMTGCCSSFRKEEINSNREEGSENYLFRVAYVGRPYINGTEFGVSVEGRIDKGTISVNDEVQIFTSTGLKKIRIGEISIMRKTISSATVGDNVRLLLCGISFAEVKVNDIISSSHSMQMYTSIEAYVDFSDEHIPEFELFDNDVLNFRFGSNLIEGKIKLLEEACMIIKGDRTKIKIEFNAPVYMDELEIFSIFTKNKWCLGEGIVYKFIK